MIKRFYRSKFDIENLSRLRTSIQIEIDSFDYRGVVVNKPWGYEYLMYDNPHVAVWALYLKYGHKTSMHCHPNKKTSLLVVSGEVVCTTLEGWLTRKIGEGVVIDEGVFHTTHADSSDGAFIIEVESPPNKKDLVRLKDEYGRKDLGYEGTSQMSKELDKYEYVDFHHTKFIQPTTKILRDATLSITRHSHTEDMYTYIRQEKANLLCLLKGKLHARDGGIILATGETAAVSQLRRRSHIYALSDILSFTLFHGKHY